MKIEQQPTIPLGRLVFCGAIGLGVWKNGLGIYTKNTLTTPLQKKKLEKYDTFTIMY